MDPSGSQWIRDLWGTKCRKLSETGASRSFGSWRIAADIPMPWRRDPVDPRSTRSTRWDPVAKHMCHVLPFCSIDFYWFLWSLHPVDVQKHSKPSITIPWSRHMFHSSFQVHSIFNRMINSGCVRFSPICHGNFGEFRHMLQHLAHLPKHPQIICFLLCLWCLCFIFDKHNQTWYTIEIYI